MCAYIWNLRQLNQSQHLGVALLKKVASAVHPLNWRNYPAQHLIVGELQGHPMGKCFKQNRPAAAAAAALFYGESRTVNLSMDAL